MKDELTKTQIEAILQAFDEALKTGPWDETNFLRMIGKNLREIRENFTSHTGLRVLEPSKKINELTADHAQRLGLQEIFISLYSTEGNQLQSWERILSNLPRQMISRPIYSTEQDVKHWIKSKETPINEAYVSIYINQNDILNLGADKKTVDKFGKPLLNLKDKAINLDNLNQLVHVSGTYRYWKGRLIKNG